MTWLAAIIGVIVGQLAFAIWRWTGTVFKDHGFWPSVQEVVSCLGTDPDNAKFLQAYATMLRKLGRFLLQTTCRTAMTVAPVVGVVLCCWPLMTSAQFRQATGVVILASQDIRLQIATRVVKPDEGIYRWAGFDQSDEVRLVAADWSGRVPNRQPLVVTSSRSRQAVWMAAGFQTLYDPAAPFFLLIRPAVEAQAKSPLWPYLSDPECAFWFALLLGPTLGLLVKPTRLGARRLWTSIGLKMPVHASPTPRSNA